MRFPPLPILLGAVPAILCAQVQPAEVQAQIKIFRDMLGSLEAVKGPLSAGSEKAAQSLLFATTIKLQTEQRAELRQTLLLGRYLLQQRALPGDHSGEGPNARRDSWVRLRDLLDLSPQIPPEAAALELLTGVDNAVMKDIAWHASGGGFTNQTSDQAAVKAMAYMTAVMERNPSPAVRTTALGHLAWFKVIVGGMKRDFTEAEQLIARLEAQVPQSPEAAKLRAQIKEIREEKVLAVGQRVPAFQVPELGHPGTVLTPASFKGKYLLMDFWATWCAPCKKELPFLHQAYAKYKSKGLEILSVSHDLKVEDVVAWRKNAEHPMPWHHTFLDAKAREAMAKDFCVQGIPHILLVSPDGKILEIPGMNLRGENLDKALARFLGAAK